MPIAELRLAMGRVRVWLTPTLRRASVSSDADYRPSPSAYDAIVDHCCFAWNKLAKQPWRVMSIGLRDWARGFAQWVLV